MMNLKQVKKEKKEKNGEPQKITKLAIGKPGGAEIEGEDYEEKIEVKCLVCKKILPYEKDDDIKNLVNSILNASSENEKKAQEEWELTICPCEHSNNLEQSEGISLDEKNLAKCKDCKLDKNLWLCLTCGNLACGRKETGGNLHAIEHFKNTKHPLVVKFGTLAPDQEASLYCYACDNDVKDKNLEEHLKKLGIDLKKQKKTDKSITEMNLSINLNFTLSKTIEEGKVLTPLYGPGFTGLENLGNSCYMNSIIQILLNLEPFKNRYYEKALEHFNLCSKDSSQCFLCQMSKISYGLHSGIYSQKKTRHLPPTEENKEGEIEEYQDGIRPSSFKLFFGEGNEDFSSNKQQDAFEYLNYLLEKMRKEEKKYKKFDPLKLFEFDMETRIECNDCHYVKYNNTRTWFLPLFVEDWEKKKEETAKCTMDEVLSKFLSSESVELECAECKKKTFWTKNQRIVNYPEYLIIVFQRFEFEKGNPIKLEVSFEPTLDNFDLKLFSKSQKKENEKILDKEKEENYEKEKKEKEKQKEKEEKKEDKKEEEKDEDMEEQDIQFNEEKVNYLLQCGVPELGAKWSLYLCNHDQEAALGFYCENSENPEYQKPLPKIKVKKNKNKDEDLTGIDLGSLTSLIEMSFNRKKAINALRLTNNNVDEALNILFNDPNAGIEENEDEKKMDLEDKKNDEEKKMEIEEEEKNINEGNGSVYDICGFITHLGKNTHHGHYVCHVRQEGNKWTYFNDMKVALWENPLIQKGYIYFYKNHSNDKK